MRRAARSTTDADDRRRLVAVSLVCVLCVLVRRGRAARAGARRRRRPSRRRSCKAAIDKLGDLDYATRTAASRTVRRTPAAQAVPALLQAVAEHADGYVRYRALVLLTGFNDPRTKDAMRESLASPNDRLRTVAYSFFEHNPDPRDGARAARRARQGAGRVRAARRWSARWPRSAPIRACSRRSSRDVGRGEDFFRSAVIEALGDYKARVRVRRASTAIAKLDGPLQDDAALALGKIGDKRALATLAGAAADGAARGAAVDRRGDLPARRQLRRRTSATSSRR